MHLFFCCIYIYISLKYFPSLILESALAYSWAAPTWGNSLISDSDRSNIATALCRYYWIHYVSPMAQALKAKGNELFKAGDFVGAEDLYSQA